MKHTLVYNYIYNMYQKIKNDQSFESIKKKKKKKDIYIVCHSIPYSNLTFSFHF